MADVLSVSPTNSVESASSLLPALEQTLLDIRATARLRFR